MSGGIAHYEFQTTGFIDSAQERAERVNEHIGSLSLARWLSASLRARGIEVSDPWGEDHGSDFSITDSGKTYLCVCFSDDEALGETAAPRLAGVSLDQARSLTDRLFRRNRASKDDTIGIIIQDLLRAHPEITQLTRMA